MTVVEKADSNNIKSALLVDAAEGQTTKSDCFWAYWKAIKENKEKGDQGFSLRRSQNTWQLFPNLYGRLMKSGQYVPADNLHRHDRSQMKPGLAISYGMPPGFLMNAKLPKNASTQSLD